MGTPCNYTAVKPGNCPRNLIRFAAPVSLIGIKDAKNKIKNRVINKEKGKRGENQGFHLIRDQCVLRNGITIL